MVFPVLILDWLQAYEYTNYCDTYGAECSLNLVTKYGA